MGTNLNKKSIFFSRTKANKSVYEKIFLLYYPRLKKYAFYFLKNHHEAEDLVQDVFFQVWEKSQNLNDEKHISSYLFTLVKHRCLNAIKRKVVEDKYVTSQAKIETEELYHISFEIDENYSSMEEKLHAELEKILNEMPDRCAEAFRLKWIEGKKIREISTIMKVSSSMVDKHLAKGLQIAKQKLTPDLFLFLFILKK